MADRSQTSTGLSVYVYGGLHKALTLPALVLLAKTNSIMFLKVTNVEQIKHELEFYYNFYSGKDKGGNCLF